MEPPKPKANKGPPQGLQHAIFMQEKLETLYRETYQFLGPRKEWIEAVENVLVWNKPLVSAFLYLLVHWIFIIFAQNSEGFVTRLGYLLVWGVAADVLWRAAHNQFGDGGRAEEKKQSLLVLKHKKKVPPFESALILRSTRLKEKELPAIEVISLWLAEVLMWLDNLFVALRHWSINEPKLFSVCIGVPGIILSLIGKYFPTIVLAYIIVIALLTWPYIEYHNLRSRMVLYITTNYPQGLGKLKALWIKFKAFASKDKSDFSEVSLTSAVEGAEGDDVFEQWLSSPTHGSDRALPTTHSVLEEPPQRTDPGMSILQDSVLGLRPSAFQSMDDSLALGSLSLGPGDMPSINDMEQSISLPQFPSSTLGQGGGGALEQSISLPQFPSARGVTREGTRGQDMLHMSSIDEEDILLPARANSRDLDPLLDSLEVEFSSQNFTDGGPHPRHPPTHRMEQILEEATDPRSDNDSSARDAVLRDGFVAPPPYHAAVDGSDGGVPLTDDGRGSEPGDSSAADRGGYWLRQRKSNY